MVEDEAMISSPLFVFFRFGEEICFLLFGLRVPLFLFLSARAPQRELESEARGSGEWILARGRRRERERERLEPGICEKENKALSAARLHPFPLGSSRSSLSHAARLGSSPASD